MGRDQKDYSWMQTTFTFIVFVVDVDDGWVGVGGKDYYFFD